MVDKDASKMIIDALRETLSLATECDLDKALRRFQEVKIPVGFDLVALDQEAVTEDELLDLFVKLDYAISKRSRLYEISRSLLAILRALLYIE